MEYEFQKLGCEGKACGLYYEHSRKGKGIGEGQTLKTRFVYNEELQGCLQEQGAQKHVLLEDKVM